MKFLFSLFIFGILSGGEAPIFISLGSYCAPAYVLKEMGLRKPTFPFDWILSIDGEKLLEVLEDDFLHFLDLEYLIPGPKSELLGNTYYHLEFSHTKKSNGLPYYYDNEELDKFIASYQRKIERFRNLKSYPGKVYFVRVPCALSTIATFKDEKNLEISEEYAIRLYNTLKRRFENIDLSLIIINQSKDVREVRKNITENIVMFSLSITPWESIFKQLIHESSSENPLP
jgi:hypothetical protein